MTTRSLLLGAIFVTQVRSVRSEAVCLQASVQAEAPKSSDTGQNYIGERSANGVPSVAGDHQLLQTGSGLSAASVNDRVRRSPGQGGDHQHDASGCAGMSHVKRKCSSNGCKVLADGMRGRTCRKYCGDNGLVCVGAWEERRNDCRVKATMTCDQIWPRTTDLLCECAAAARDPSMLKLVWLDDFDGNRINESKWSIVEEGGGFGNWEKQYYTGRAANLRVGGGVLTITAKCEEYNRHQFTSAKVQTKHKGKWGPGHRVEVRARLPKGKGAWSAIWMLPEYNDYGTWPVSGEIDIMESVGCNRGNVFGTVHTAAYNHMLHTEKSNSKRSEIGEWHTYAIEWSSSRILWFVDGHLYHSFARSFHGYDKWPFDRTFFLILNLAVGGSWGGMCVRNGPSCSSNDEFGRSQVMEVDFVRIYAM